MESQKEQNSKGCLSSPSAERQGTQETGRLLRAIGVQSSARSRHEGEIQLPVPLLQLRATQQAMGGMALQGYLQNLSLGKAVTMNQVHPQSHVIASQKVL